MKLLILLISIFSMQMTFACQLNTNIVSLSNPITTLLEELELLHTGKVKAISSFHKTLKPFKGDALAGGIFLSKATLQKLSDSVVFFDASKEFEDSLKSSNVKNYVKVKTIGEDPFTVSNSLISKIKPYVEGCEQNIKKISEKLVSVKSGLKKKLSRKKAKIIFFLGSCGDKLPELVIVEDGFVKFLKDEKIIKTYPSELSYVTWSKKILNDLRGFQYFCIDTKASKYEFKVSKKDNVNISFGDAFNPGLAQVYFLEKLSTLF
jgi:hypothetical protein